MGYLYLALAIALELAGTTSMKYSEGFTKLIPSAAVIFFYIVCFFFLTKSLSYINLGVAYATWAGVGLVGATGISILVFKESITIIGILGIILVVCGVAILNLYGTAH